jgi:hypothetical protein
MSLFVEVESVDKNCKVIINLDEVVEIAPLIEGGCALFFTDNAGTNSKSTIKVKDSYDQFKQFVMQTVTAEDISKKVKSMKSQTSQPMEIPKL